MIYETIVTTQNQQAVSHIAPMGIHVRDDDLIVMPFRPSTTLNNFLETGVGVINYCDDVRVFAGCLTGRKDWPLVAAQHIQGKVLACALAHTEIELVHIEDAENRPKLFCKSLYTNNHAAFQGYNRAQSSVLEAAILISRLEMLPIEKIEAELSYLKIGLDKTAGAREIEAWGWLMATFQEFKARVVT